SDTAPPAFYPLSLHDALPIWATALCLDELLPDNSIALEGAQIIEAFDRKFVFVAVHGLGGREAQLLTGTCEIRESGERSAVLAVLDATNRWADARRYAVVVT